MTNLSHLHHRLTRRDLLRYGGSSITAAALTSLLAQDSVAAPADPLAPKQPHFPPRAKSVIYLFSSGGVSQLDLFDPKPTLIKQNGKPVPEDLVAGQRFAFISGRPNLMASPYTFEKYGESGCELSNLLPHLATVADEATVVRSLQTSHVNHGPAQLLLWTGFERAGRPSLGAWSVYGLGSVNRDLPAYVVLSAGNERVTADRFSSGFLPSVYQGVRFRSKGDPVLFLSDSAGVKREERRDVIDTITALDRELLADVGDPEIATRIAQYEMAFKMQASVPELVDLSNESAATLEEYGVEPGVPSLAASLLQARRLVERGVRFVSIFDSGWDHHERIFHELPRSCANLDRPLAALVRDLKQRGLLDETLVVWTGEFGRTPMLQGPADPTKSGRDHHKEAFVAWLAGGGVKRGLTLGATDEFGFKAVEDPVHIHDLNATILHLLGFDHEKLTYRSQGRDFRLTDVHGSVVKKLLS